MICDDADCDSPRHGAPLPLLSAIEQIRSRKRLIVASPLDSQTCERWERAKEEGERSWSRWPCFYVLPISTFNGGVRHKARVPP